MIPPDEEKTVKEKKDKNGKEIKNPDGTPKMRVVNVHNWLKEKENDEFNSYLTELAKLFKEEVVIPTDPSAYTAEQLEQQQRLKQKADLAFRITGGKGKI